MVEERDSARREALDLRARVTELKSEVTIASISVAELAEAVRARERYRLLL